MEKAINFKSCTIDPRKIEDYCLNETHPIGKHKARLFKTRLSFSRKDSNLLISLIRKEVIDSNPVKLKTDRYGDRYVVDLKIRNFEKEAQVRTVWIVDKNESIPRLVSAYILPE